MSQEFVRVLVNGKILPFNISLFETGYDLAMLVKRLFTNPNEGVSFVFNKKLLLPQLSLKFQGIESGDLLICLRNQISNVPSKASIQARRNERKQKDMQSMLNLVLRSNDRLISIIEDKVKCDSALLSIIDDCMTFPQSNQATEYPQSKTIIPNSSENVSSEPLPPLFKGSLLPDTVSVADGENGWHW